jgi:hypothetical protein
MLPLAVVLLAQSMPFGGFDVRVLTRQEKHRQTAAMLCALRLEKQPIAFERQVWIEQFPDGPSKDDELLVYSTTQQLCPGVPPSNR